MTQRPIEEAAEDFRSGWDMHVGFGLEHPALFSIIGGNPQPDRVKAAQAGYATCGGRSAGLPARRSFEAVAFDTLEWVDWFNDYRLLEPIGYMSAAEAEARYHAAMESQTKTPPGKPGAVQYRDASASEHRTIQRPRDDPRDALT